MGLSSIVNVQISRSTASVSRVGFGVPMIMSAEAFVDSRFSDTTKIYTDITQMGSTGDNFDVNGVTYIKAQKEFSQNPGISQLVIGKRALLPLMISYMTPVVRDSTAYTVTIGGEAFTYTSDATATAAEIIQGLLALINAGGQDVLATDQTTFLSIAKADAPGGLATVGKTFTLKYSRALWTVQNATTDPGITTDLTTIRTAIDGNDDWYCASIDSSGAAEIEAMAAAIEASLKIFIAATSDADVLTSATTDVGSNLQASSYFRTSLMWHEEQLGGIEAAWAGIMLPFKAGSATWKFKTLAGIPFSVLTPSETAELVSKSVNMYTRIAGNNITSEGVMASGEFIDITRGIDSVVAGMMEDVFGALIRVPKAPFTDPGIGLVEAPVRGGIARAVSDGIFAADPAPIVTVPLAANVSINDKANRVLPDMGFTAVLAGAIHAVDPINGNVTL